MSKSNWKGSAAWGAAQDFTNILENNCLVLSSENKDFSEDYVLQQLGTSTGLTHLNIGIKFNYAWNVNSFSSTEFGAVVRADNFTSGTTLPSLAQNAYIGKVNTFTRTAYLCKRQNNALLTLYSSSVDPQAISPETKNTFELKSYSTDVPVVELILNNRVIISYRDTSRTPLNSGYVGLHCSTGNVYVTSVVLLEYSESGT